MGIFQAIGNGFKVTHRNWAMILLFFVFYLVMGLVNLPIQNHLPAPGSPIQSLPPAWLILAILLMLVNFFAGVFLQGGLLNFVKEDIKSGKAIFDYFWQGGKKFYLKLLGFSLLIVAAIVVLMTIFLMGGLLFSVVAGNNQAIVTTVFLIFIILGGIIGFIGSIFVIFSPFIIVEREEKLFPAIGESFNLAKENFLRILALLILLGIGIVAIFFLVNLLFPRVTLPLQVLYIFISSALTAYFSLIVISSMMEYYLAVSQPKEEPTF